MPFQRSCIYHINGDVRVLEENQEDEYKQLLETGIWFEHPLKAKEARENNEKQIRQRTRKSSSNAKLTSVET